MAFVGSSGGRCAAATSDLGARRPAACADRLLGPCTAAAHPRPVGLHHAPPAPKPTPAAAPARGRGRQGVVACRAAPSSVSSATKDNEYNRVMQQQMGWGHLNPYEYHFDRGLYYHEVAPNLICGTQPRNTSDVRTLREREGITTILNVRRAGVASTGLARQRPGSMQAPSVETAGGGASCLAGSHGTAGGQGTMPVMHAACMCLSLRCKHIVSGRGFRRCHPSQVHTHMLLQLHITYTGMPSRSAGAGPHCFWCSRCLLQHGKQTAVHPAVQRRATPIARCLWYALCARVRHRHRPCSAPSTSPPVVPPCLAVVDAPPSPPLLAALPNPDLRSCSRTRTCSTGGSRSMRSAMRARQTASRSCAAR